MDIKVKNLPKTIKKIARQYGLTDLEPLSQSDTHYVMGGIQNLKPIILKLSFDQKSLSKETACLKVFSKYGAAKVIAHDSNMIILERAMPGITLKENFPLKDDESTKILCALIKELHLADIPRSHDFDHVRDLLKILDQELLDIPGKFLSKARRLRDELLCTTQKEVLLHGDLHHGNIVKNGNSWLVIDPKGFIGDPALEPAAYLCNPIPELLQEVNAKQIIENRIQLFSKHLKISEQRIRDWLYVKSVLCWAWSLEDAPDKDSVQSGTYPDPGYWSTFFFKI